MLKFFFFILPLMLALYALVDCVQTPSAEIRWLPKPAWLAVIVLPLIGPLLWVFGAKRNSPLRDLVWPSTDGPPAGLRPGRRTVAPDDDPDFLRKLGHPGRPTPPNKSGKPDKTGKPDRGSRPTGRGSTRDEDALLEEWERDLRRGEQQPGSPDRPEDDGPEGSTDGAPRV